MSLVPPQTVQPGGVAVMPDHTITRNDHAIKTKGILAAEAAAEEAHRKQIEAQQDQVDLDAQREWAEGDAAEKAAAQAEQAEIRRQTLATEREEQLQVKRTAQRAAEEDAEKKANLGDYWDTQSTPKRIFAAVLMGLSKGEPGGAADIYKDASARYRQGEIDKFNAATLAAKGRAGDTANHEEDTKRFMLELSTKETARDNLLKKRLATFVAQQPKAATAGAKLTAEMEVNQAKNKQAQENIFKKDWSQSVVEGKAAPGGSAPTVTDQGKAATAKIEADQAATDAAYAAKNPEAVAEAAGILRSMAKTEKFAEGGGKNLVGMGTLLGAVPEAALGAAKTPEGREMLKVFARQRLGAATIAARGGAIQAGEQAAGDAISGPGYGSHAEVVAGLQKMARDTRQVADAMDTRINPAGPVLATVAPATPKAPVAAPAKEAKAVDPVQWARSPEGRAFFKAHPDAAAAFRAEYAKKAKK